jgi:hypothetical protein
VRDQTVRAHSDRLDSWQEIADYLGRDVRTARRWERLGLPVRRVGGNRGRSVFAHRSELDAWLTSAGAGSAPAAPDAIVSAGRRAGVAGVPTRAWWLASAAVALGVLLIAWWALAGRGEGLTVQVLPEAIVASAGGTVRWRHAYPPGEMALLPEQRAAAEIVTGKGGGVLAATSYHFRPADDTRRSGELLWLSPDGAVERRASFDDSVAFGAGTYGAPWTITDYRVRETGSGRRIALAGHHMLWWPSLVTVLDDAWTRVGTFVNAGWIERVHWLTDDHLLVTGFSNTFDGGAVALLDVKALDGQSPAPAGSRFGCTSCGPGAPLRYIVLPRSEVNRASRAPFNRARLDVMGDRLIVRTIEVPSTGAEAVDALYEFSLALALVRATFSDRYWEVHAALEARGAIGHPREQCPDRDGPREIRVWEPQRGWRTERTR